MAKQKPSTPKGTRDFTPVEMIRRNFIFDTIKNIFHLYGYLPIETPAMENLSSLLGKYGEEGDKLLFRILNSGNYLSKLDENERINLSSGEMSSKICDRGLRYDLTVPFARFVVQHQSEISFPFKRYQIQPVWRADRPQKGRYREFYQCDADVVGSDALINEAELIEVVDRVFDALSINVVIKLNNRKILAGIAEYIGEKNKITDITVAIDKLDKIGQEKVNEELVARGLSSESVSKLQPVLTIAGSRKEKFAALKNTLSISEQGLAGIAEAEEVFGLLDQMSLKNPVELDLTLARGLNYYTGAIIEVKATDVNIGSICGGGRYDDLTGIFGMERTSGVGISFGADRIYDVLLQLKKFPYETGIATYLLFVNFGKEEMNYCLPLLQKLRLNKIPAEIYPDPVKMKKQFNYANNKNIKYVAIAGEEEINSNLVTIKNMTTGEQKSINKEDILEFSHI
jgi:histidyl-tRNA synthetase